MKKITIALLIMVSFIANAQRTCGLQEKMNQIMADPAQRAAYLQQQQLFDVELDKLQNNTHNKNAETSSLNTIRIPVAVHFPSVLPSSSATLKTCLQGQAQNQINILNADYNGTNSDVSLWTNDAPLYPMVSGVGSLNVQFVLATQNHPAGTGLTNGTVAVTFGTDFLSNSDVDTTWSGYMNIVVRNIAGGVLGYSPLGGSPGSGHTVVIDNNAFGSIGCTGYAPGAPYNKGRTLTHELGHFFNLDHTFNTGNCSTNTNCNTQGDRVCDTPQVAAPTYECWPAGTFNGCVSNEYALTMNYMDYVEDVCMYMFTPGQATRMQAYYNAVSGQFTTTALSNNQFLENSFTIYPNPNKGSFAVEFKDFVTSFSIEVFDITGKVIYENEFNQLSSLIQNVTMENTTSGVYFVNIKSENGIITKKLIIQ